MEDKKEEKMTLAKVTEYGKLSSKGKIIAHLFDLIETVAVVEKMDEVTLHEFTAEEVVALNSQSYDKEMILKKLCLELRVILEKRNVPHSDGCEIVKKWLAEPSA